MREMTAKEFQRNIGRAQDLALREPLAITFHGRERLVLLSADDYHELAGSGAVPTRNAKHEIKSALRKSRSTLQARGINGLHLFGSVARGDDRPNSDVDVMIETYPGTELSLFDLSEIQHLLSMRLNRNVDVALAGTLPPAVQREFDRDGERIF